MKRRHVIIACGGTGGHLAPGIALAEALVSEGHRATLLISHKKVDTKLVEKYPALRFLRVPGAGWVWTPLGVLRFLVSQTKGLLFSLWLVIRDKPDAVVGFGGFTTTTIILAAALRSVPVFLHESNHVPGKAIRWLQPLARRVYLPPGVTLPQVAAERQAQMGMPVRAEITRMPAEEARARWGLRLDRPVVVVLGGSQGATALNDWATAIRPTLVQAGVQMVCVTGLGKGQDETRLEPSPYGPLPQVTLAFCDQMAALFSAADLVVTRAGAGTLAEMAQCGTPGILVPYPHAADNHQEANARYVAEQGGGVVIPQTRLEEVGPLLLGWLAQPEILQRMQQAQWRLARANTIEGLRKDMRRAWEFGS